MTLSRGAAQYLLRIGFAFPLNVLICSVCATVLAGGCNLILWVADLLGWTANGAWMVFDMVNSFIQVRCGL